MRPELEKLIKKQHKAIRAIEELAALRAFVREVANQDPAQPTGQRESNKSRAEDLCEQWGITA